MHKEMYCRMSMNDLYMVQLNKIIMVSVKMKRSVCTVAWNQETSIKHGKTL